MPEPPTPVRRGRLLRIGASVVVLLAVATYVAVQYATGGRSTPRCVVVSANGDGATYEFTSEQAVNAATISAVGTSHGMPERAVTIALATALQESGLRNIHHGDRDSLGLFQQRPSEGWGTKKQIMDPVYAAERFYERLAQIPGYSRLPLTVAAQRVQRSGYPQAYAKHEPDATLLAASLTGRAAASLTCEGRPAGADSARARGPVDVKTALVRDFGQDVAPATGEDRRSVRVQVPATVDSAEGGERQRGWELAQWAVANSSALHIERVSYAGREWTAGETGNEWQGASSAGGAEAGSDGSAGVDEVRIVTGQ
ncbi:heavy metal transporter [Streptomyces sp. VRA16 Mangrove soil]|uniref:heavy metal transporter n=1 Tax=Streptomyces sp. VRA16 Mangrove soil TaxID=2817434 RepID=UPI001A9D9DC4|nr:heavy metal transporter [Streptomyces sp. VRA16 Mangrove soil]MBO1337032.1 heavy metal transporter [Streptomyces sp. VRA16 Mangrove soil]